MKSSYLLGLLPLLWTYESEATGAQSASSPTATTQIAKIIVQKGALNRQLKERAAQHTPAQPSDQLVRLSLGKGDGAHVFPEDIQKFKSLAATKEGVGKTGQQDDIAPLAKKALSDTEAQALKNRLKRAPYAQTEGFLKVVLGPKFHEHSLRRNIDTYLRTIHAKLNPKYEAGMSGSYAMPVDVTLVADNQSLQNTLLDILKKEASYKDKIALYHGASGNVGAFVDIISAFRNHLNISSDQLNHTFRATDTAFEGLPDVEAFIELTTSRQMRSGDSIDYVDGYLSRGMSANFFLFGNYHAKGSYTFGYFLSSYNIKPLDIRQFLQHFFTSIGFDKAAAHQKTQEYSKLIQTHNRDKVGHLFQIFIDPSVVDEMVYVAEEFGAPLNLHMNAGTPPTHKPTDVLPLERENPEEFTKMLESSKKSFHHTSGNYAAALQARLFAKPEFMHDPKLVQVFTYDTTYDPKAHADFLKALDAKVQEDLAELLAKKDTSTSTAVTGGITPLQKLHQSVTGQHASGDIEINPTTLGHLIFSQKAQDTQRVIKAFEDQKFDLMTTNAINPDSLKPIKPLTLAVIAGNVELVKFFLSHGESLYFSNDDVLLTGVSANFELLPIILEHRPTLINYIAHEGGNLTFLILAAQAGNINAVTLLLDKGADVNLRAYELTPLIAGVKGGNLKVVKLLLSHGAKINLSSKVGDYTPLRTAIIMDNLPMIELLLSHGAKITTQILSLAIEKSQISTVKFLLDHGASPNATDPGYRAPLMDAIDSNHQELIQLLLSHKADINQISGSGKEATTPLGFAVQRAASWSRHVKDLPPAQASSFLNLIQFLVTIPGINLNIPDDNPPLMIALKNVMAGVRKDFYIQVCKILLKAKADAHVVATPLIWSTYSDKPQGKEKPTTPFMEVMDSKDQDLIKFLLDNGVNPNGHGDFVPLIEAVYNNDIETASLLLHHGANVNQTLASKPSSPLHVAIYGDNVDMVKFLLSHHADLSIPTAALPLDAAIRSNHVDIVRLLLEAGADSNKGPSPTLPPLLLALFFCEKESILPIATLLLEHKANPNLPTSNPPLHKAITKKNLALCKLLIDHGADVNLKDRDDMSPLDVAEQKKVPEIIDLLKAHGAKA
jgi:ankyrin repeat protein